MLLGGAASWLVRPLFAPETLLLCSSSVVHVVGLFGARLQTSAVGGLLGEGTDAGGGMRGLWAVLSWLC
jgi:hypothetical protein